MVARARFLALSEEWRVQIAGDHLTVDGLRRLRARIDPQSSGGREFVPADDGGRGPVSAAELEALCWDVDEALAAKLGVPLGHMPGRAPVADDLSGLEGLDGGPRPGPTV